VAQLQIRRGDAVTALPLSGERATIGRSEECSIRLSGDPSVSREHAVLERGDGWTVRDLQSSNGTYVNGNRIDAPVSLAFGDSFQVGKFVLTLLGSPADNASTLHDETPSAPADISRLTKREKEVLALVALGSTDQGIAHQLGITVKTVHSHLERIHEKTGRRRRPDLTRLAIEAGIISSNDAP
jgi:DNA-binding CsgD family transcriptional regulator